MNGVPEKLHQHFTTLYDTHAQALLTFTYYRLHNRALAEDVVADAFCKFWQRLASGVEITYERALLYTITRGLIIDQYRKQAVSQSVPLEEEMNALVVDNTVVEILDARYAYARVAKALQGVKQEYADILVLHYLQELSILEIAHILELSENNVRVRIHRALAALRKILDHEQP